RTTLNELARILVQARFLFINAVQVIEPDIMGARHGLQIPARTAATPAKRHGVVPIGCRSGLGEALLDPPEQLFCACNQTGQGGKFSHGRRYPAAPHPSACAAWATTTTRCPAVAPTPRPPRE